MLFVTGNEVLPPFFGTAAFNSIAQAKGQIKVMLNSGRLPRETLRRLHGAAFSAWQQHRNAMSAGVVAPAAIFLAATDTELALTKQTPQAAPRAELALQDNSAGFLQLSHLLQVAEENRVRDRAADLARQEERDKAEDERRVSEKAAVAEARRCDKAAEEERWRVHLAEQKAQSEVREREQASITQRAQEERSEEKKAAAEERRLDKLANDERRALQAEHAAHQAAEEKAQRAIDKAAIGELRQNAIIDRDASNNVSKRTLDLQLNMFEWMKESKEVQERREKREVEEHDFRMSERRRAAENKAAARSEATRQHDAGRIEELNREEAARTAAAQADSGTERRGVADQQALGLTEGEVEEDEIDDWANSSHVLQSPATRPREERGGEKRRRRRNRIW